MKHLSQLRFYLELISVPVFAWLVIHMSGHGLMLLKDPHHSHDHHAETTYEVHADENHTEERSHEDESHEEEHHGDEHKNTHDDHAKESYTGHDAHDHGAFIGLNYWLSAEVLGGILALVFFVWLWHTQYLKPFVPCSHDRCTHKAIWPHLFATVAFVFHWFPESKLRHDLLAEFNAHRAEDIITALGFASHFLVDVIVLILLSSFWPKLWQKLFSGGLLLVFWALSVWVGKKGGLALSGISEPVILIFSAFLLAMFVHRPHRPEPECATCEK